MKHHSVLIFLMILLGCSSKIGEGPLNDENIGDGSNNVEDDNPNLSAPFLYEASQELKKVAAFRIGNIVSGDRLESTAKDHQLFKQLLTAEYNSITAENDMKMAHMFVGPDEYDFSDGDIIVAYAKEHGFRVHGHALIWHSSIPGWLDNFEGTDQEFEAQVESYVKSTVAHFAKITDQYGNPIVESWDVVNEYFDGPIVRNTLFTQRMGVDYHKKIFGWAREADAEVKLFYNDYNIAGEVDKRNAILNMVSEFIAENIPIDGIGMQMHLNHDWPSSDLPLAIEDISSTDLLVHISELDVKVNYQEDIDTFTQDRAVAQEIQYQRVGYYYTTIVPEAQQYGLTLWGFRDIDSWLYDGGSDWPLLYDNDFNTKISHRGLVAGLGQEAP